MYSIAILDDYQGVATTYADWSIFNQKASIIVFRDTLLEDTELIARLKPFDIICTMRERTRFTKSLLDELPNLKLLTTTAMGNRGIDMEAAKERGVLVSGTSATISSTLEHIWALIFTTVRFLAHEHAYIKAADPQWQHAVPMGLSGKTLGIVGLGRFGKATAEIAKAFNLNVIAWSPHLTKERAESVGVGFIETKKDLFRNADTVSIHMVLSPETRHMITGSDLSLMKPTAFLINTSRGPLIEERALLDVLKGGYIAGAGLDVFDTEPLPLDHPFRSLSNVTLSPHLGYVSDDAYKTWWKETVENIDAFFKGKPIRVINS